MAIATTTTTRTTRTTRARSIAPRRTRRGTTTTTRALRTERAETAEIDAARARRGMGAAAEDEGRDDDAVIASVGVGATCVTFKSAERRTFEVEYGARRGSTENAYAVTGETNACLIDVPDGRHGVKYAEAIASIGGEARDAAFHAVLHVNPRRLDALAACVANRSADAPCVEVLCSNPGAQIIQQALKPNNSLSNDALIASWKSPEGKLRARLRVVRNGERLDLGGTAVTFTLAPTPRWPDLMFARDDRTQALFTSKIFSAHVGQMEGFEDTGGLEAFGDDWRFYYDCLLAPMARQMSSILTRLPATGDESKHDDAVVASAICPAHGPVVSSSVTELVREYRSWTNKQTSAADKTSVAIIYASAYGNTGAMAQAIARGVAKTGVAAEMLNCELSTPAEVEEVLKRNAGFALGAPTLGGTLPTPVQTALGAIVKEADLEKPCGAFGSFGWSGEAVEMISKRLTDAGFKSAFEPLRCKFKPTAETLQLCEESGTDLAQEVRKMARRKEMIERKSLGKSLSGTNDAAAAMGRIVGSLCAVTTKSDETQSAMLASWVSQASFNPPAITVAVAKERAVESFLLTGGKFNLNVLKSGGEKPIMKALLKPFAPGENRFGDLDVDISETNGCAIVKDSLACIECKVSKRMEAGDHWVVLAEVERGALLDADGLTSMHHRKSGDSY